MLRSALTQLQTRFPEGYAPLKKRQLRAAPRMKEWSAWFRKTLPAIRLRREQKRLESVDFVIKEVDLKIMQPDGSCTRVVPKSCRKKMFEEVHRECLAGHFNAKKVQRLLRTKVSFWRAWVVMLIDGQGSVNASSLTHIPE